LFAELEKLIQTMDKKPHILFLFSDTGGGHRSAAKAIIEALEIYFPGQVTTEMLDFFVKYGPPPFDLAAATYSHMAQVPNLWAWGYKLSNGKYRSKLVYDVLWPYIRNAAKDLVKEHPCDMFVSVHPIINNPILRILDPDHAPYMIVVTDMVSTHVFWYNNNATVTLVPTEEALQRGIENGMDKDRMEVVGQPISDKYRYPTAPKAQLREQFGWPETKPVALMVGGGEGMGPIEEVVRAVDQAQLDLMMAIITGRNQTLQGNLEKKPLATQHDIFGFVENMPDLMNAADIIVTKAGPGTISEAFTAGLPIILYTRMPGQEEGNVDFVVQKGAGVWAPTPESVVTTLRDWVDHPDAREKITAISKSLARPDAAKNIAQRIIETVKKL
jgi:1,2-diacylglycerol 3-beta-galactosyltransferase